MTVYYLSGRRVTVGCLTILLLCVLSCGGSFLYLDRPQVRFRERFDLGSGLTLTIISSRRSEFDRPLDPNPLYLDYRIDVGRREVVPTTMLERDNGGEYHFRLVRTADGRLACVYEVGDTADHRSHVVIFDFESGESWPRLRDDESPNMRHVAEKWQERHQRLVSEHPDVPDPWRFAPPQWP